MSDYATNADPGTVPIEGPAVPPSSGVLGAGELNDGPTGSNDDSQTPAQRLYGSNFEELPDHLQEALRRLVMQFSTESDHSRRQEIRRIKQAHQFWRGLQYLWWSDRDQNWHLPFEQKMTQQSSIEEMPRYEFVTNIYQAFGLSIIAVLSQDVPTVRFFPQSAQAEGDIAAAKSATEVAHLVERNNRIGNLIVDEAFHLWTSGKVGAYVRYVVDGQRFGFHPEMELSTHQVKIGADSYRCQNCEAEVSGPEAQPALIGTTCPSCGAEIEEGAFIPAAVVTVPTISTQLRVANGQEVITVVGGLELKTPPWANEMHEYPYMQWNMEVHVSRLRAAYPHAADKIGPVVAPGSGQYERMARLAQSQGGPLTEGGDFNQNLITFQRTWLRPWAFYLLEEQSLRDELLALYPDGAYVAFAGDAYCESRNENMDDHWRVLHALPGDGSSGRPALGDALISVQERFNTLSNLQIETYEYGIPPIYADSEVLDFEALQHQTAEPGAHYPARSKPGQSLASGFFQPAPAQIPPDLAMHAANLMGPVAQFLTGAFPALFGGAMSNSDTAAGYAMARDQAMGRIGLVWRKMKFFHADIMLLAVDCFRRNRPRDVEVTLLGAGAAFESKWIRLADLKGSLFSYPETDEQYPTQWAQQRAVLLQLIANPDPQLQNILGSPENLALIKRLIGVEELVIPDEESRTKQYREIAQLAQETPIVSVDPSTGKESILPSIVVDAFTDNHQVELETCKRWFSSDAGQSTKIDRPAGYANVRAHALQHQQYLTQAASGA
jgi:DNA-directed RNA polymerase subunit RPC12/RpoP